MPSCNREHSLEEQVVVGAAVGAGAWASDEQPEHDCCIKTLVCGSMIFLLQLGSRLTHVKVHHYKNSLPIRAGQLRNE